MKPIRPIVHKRRRSNRLTRETGFKPQVGQINTYNSNYHRRATDAILHCVP